MRFKVFRMDVWSIRPPHSRCFYLLPSAQPPTVCMRYPGAWQPWLSLLLCLFFLLSALPFFPRDIHPISQVEKVKAFGLVFFQLNTLRRWSGGREGVRREKWQECWPSSSFPRREAARVKQRRLFSFSARCWLWFRLALVIQAVSVEEAVLSRIEREKKGEYDGCEAVAESSRQKWTTVLNRNQQPQGPAKRGIMRKVADDSKRKRQRFKGGGGWRGGNAIIKAVAVSSVRIWLQKSLLDVRGCIPLVSEVIQRMREKGWDRYTGHKVFVDFSWQ